MSELDPAAATSVVHHTIPAAGRLGIRVDSIGSEELTLRVPIEGNSNHLGTMYAGALFAVMELPGGLIPLSTLGLNRSVPILTDMQVRFVAAARTDVTLTAPIDPARWLALADEADASGESRFTLDLTATDASGRVVATSHAQYVLRPSRP